MCSSPCCRRVRQDWATELNWTEGFPGRTVVENSPASAGDARDASSIHESGRSPGGGNGNPLQYSCLGNPMDRGAWRATVHGVAESDITEKRTPMLVLFHASFSSCQYPVTWSSPSLCLSLSHTHTHTHMQCWQMLAYRVLDALLAQQETSRPKKKKHFLQIKDRQSLVTQVMRWTFTKSASQHCFFDALYFALKEFHGNEICTQKSSLPN